MISTPVTNQEVQKNAGVNFTIKAKKNNTLQCNSVPKTHAVEINFSKFTRNTTYLPCLKSDTNISIRSK